MPANYTLLEKITVGAAGASSVTFSGIPQTGYTDLVVKWSGRDSQSGATANDCAINFNGSATSFTGKRLYGNGTSALSDNQAPYAGSDTGAGATASTFSNNEIYIPNYAGSTNKSFSLDSVTERNGTEAYQLLYAGLWSNTAAITSISILAPSTHSFVQYSTFYLYGVAKLGTTPAIVPYATGGDTIMTDGTYWYHTFVSSGTFTPRKPITCDYLVVAGGGGGANDNAGGLAGGGGGAGGLRSTVTATGGGGSLESALSLGTSAYTVTIGAGGPAGANRGDIIASGSNSVFSTITSLGGSAGLSNGASQVTGGSGGGGIGYQFGGAGCAGTANQGYAGGSVVPSADTPGGGGGGAGAVGGNTSGGGGNGGAGVATSITGSSVTYAGGGGGSGKSPQVGGSGGSGGGGRGAGTSSSLAGTANTGGGGGGGTSSFAASAGGSGIVVIRYAV